ncbi:LEAF RUST 10 DISEASE-RESISTANCE LOCUS RECEPTOR-LIKE PROTEIN KINASE-like 1.1 [Mercurialis annua]|uniref:LEAF RUST 10 DISEASE-RESISTANCE LOCUS RECEPTOR-LIKE PROTEIN KINASE-like 1.1 n=1 Tax=Mercurialis annua TaxID=3986 RepID=UPI0021609BC1|nr:LEAF RUST 10 DISEASE-RESISTANCE LOCUS RECEPTOR-LIKE PROTEIN KINASE-like 1.1 [Mercurialis annua]
MGNMNMAAISLFVLFALSEPVFLLPLKQENNFQEQCPVFRCGNSHISYPFSNKTENAKCGPFVVDGCDNEHQQISLDRGSGKWYRLQNISFEPFSSEGSFSIIDRELQYQLNTRNCASFNNLSLPHIQYVDIQIPNSITFFKCNHTIRFPNSAFDHEYSECPNFNIFYTDMNAKLPSPPTNCSSISLPANTDKGYTDIFNLLTGEFSLQVTIRPEFILCYYDCLLNKGTCQRNNRTKRLECMYTNGRAIDIDIKIPSPQSSFPPSSSPIPQKESKKGSERRVITGVVCGAMVLTTVVLAIFFWYRHNRKNASTNLQRTNTYSRAFSKSDLENANIYFGLSIFSYSELEDATKNFASENELGDGGFGTVYYGKLQDGREVAVKRLYERNYRKVNQFLNEIEILTRLRHQNLVSLYGCTSRRSRELLLVYEYIPNGTVADHLHGNQAKCSPLTWPVRLKIAIETANALVYLHASDIIHRDVKTNNILLDNNFCVKVADFGISRLFPTNATHISTAPQGTPGYVDPEYFNCYQLTEKSDVYSFGVVLAELISSMPAVDITRERHDINLSSLAINKIQKNEFNELIDPFLGYQSNEEIKKMTTLVAELAFLCLQQDKEMRPTMDEIQEELKRIENGEYEWDTPDQEEHEDP